MLYIKIVTLFVRTTSTSCMSVYEHALTELCVIVFVRSQVQARILPIVGIDSTRNLKQPTARLSEERALSVDILLSRCIRLIHNVFFIRRMSER